MLVVVSSHERVEDIGVVSVTIVVVNRTGTVEFRDPMDLLLTASGSKIKQIRYIILND